MASHTSALFFSKRTPVWVINLTHCFHRSRTFSYCTTCYHSWPFRPLSDLLSPQIAAPCQVKALQPEDRVMVVGNSRHPFDANVAELTAFFGRMLYCGLPDYPSRLRLWRMLLRAKGCNWQRGGANKITTSGQRFSLLIWGSIPQPFLFLSHWVSPESPRVLWGNCHVFFTHVSLVRLPRHPRRGRESSLYTPPPRVGVVLHPEETRWF